MVSLESAINLGYDHEVAVKFTQVEHTRDEEVNIWPSLQHASILSTYEVNCLQHVIIINTPRLFRD